MDDYCYSKRLEDMTEASQDTATELAALPIKQKLKREVHVKGIIQKLWYGGCELTSLAVKGSILM